MSLYTLSNDLNLISNYFPGVICWRKDVNSVFTDANQACAALFDLSINNLIGKSDKELPTKASEFAHVFRHQDKEAMILDKPVKTLDIHPYAKNNWKILFCVKMPYKKNNDQRTLQGTYGYALDLTSDFFKFAAVLSKTLSPLREGNSSHPLKLLQDSYLIGEGYGDIKLTRRQAECLFLLLNGLTAKKIGCALNLSARTVEGHLDILKNKFQCQSQSELITTAIARGIVNIIPSSLLLNSQLSVILDSE